MPASGSLRSPPEALASSPRAAKKERGPKYEESNRYLRGRVLASLREEPSPDSVALPDLARRLRGDAAVVEPVRLMEVVESLERDGLARVTHPAGRSTVHPAGAVAEERAPYAAGAEEPDEIRVSLP